MRKTAIIMAVTLLAAGGAAFANDCVSVFGRNDEIINVHAKNISMREEEIVITLRKDYYEVDVTFDFFNSGPEEKVQLGFPVKFVGIAGRFEDYNFKSYINGKIIPLHTTKKDTIAIEDGYYSRGTLWFIRNVTFPANSRTVSRVTYKAEYSQCGGPYAGYIYGTGRFWKGGIGKMTVVINHGDDVLIKHSAESIKAQIKAKSSNFIWEADGRYKYIFENVNPTSGDEKIHIYIKTFESGLYGEYGKYGNPFGTHPDDNPDGAYGWVWDKYLLYEKPTEIQLYTKNQIRLFINFFSAIHGYDFKNPLYKEYFRKIEDFDIYSNDNKKIKYEVNPNFNESLFNEFERKNVAYLLKLEKMIPNKTGEEKPK